MKILKNIWGQLHRFLLWTVILALLWSWIYVFVGDTTREKKVVVYVDGYGVEQRDLGLRLEDEGLPEGIKMIQVRSFQYDLFGTALDGDVYLLKESLLRAMLEETPDKLLPLEVPAGMTGWSWEGETCAVLVYDAETGRGPAMNYVRYTAPDTEPENYYLCFDAAGLHLEDGAAWKVALELLKLE